MSVISKKYGIWIVLAVALAVKMLFAAFVFNHNPGGIWVADSSSYWQPAQSLLQHGTFSVSPDQAGVPETTRTPGYPFFVSLVLSVVYNSAWTVILVQVFLSLMTICFVFQKREKNLRFFDFTYSPPIPV
jgi:protein-S-isoprenylcysteine O-methyltransferase Ste14